MRKFACANFSVLNSGGRLAVKIRKCFPLSSAVFLFSIFGLFKFLWVCEGRMISRSSSNVSQKTLQIEQEDRFFSRLLAKEVSVRNSSFEVYHGEASAGVPFTWESQPGTPKFRFLETPLPPLTPPPSYYSSTMKNSMKKHSKARFLNIIITRFTSRKTSHPTSPVSSTSSSSSSQSRSSSPTTPSNFRAQLRNSTRRRSFDSIPYEEDFEHELPTSTLCFGLGLQNEFKVQRLLCNHHEGIPQRFSINSCF